MKVAATSVRSGLPDSNSPFLFLVLLAVPASLASLNNGQTNLPLSACLVFGVFSVRSEKWIWASLCLWLAVILKPIALAPWLLAFASFPQIRKPLLLGSFPFLLMGLAHPDFHYASERWVKCLEKIFRSYNPENLRVSDLFGMLEKAGVSSVPLVNSVTRALACFGALVWVRRSYRRNGLAPSAWALWVATAMVFTIFNPRVETNGYVLISPLLGFQAISYWREEGGSSWKAWVLAVACFGLMCDGMGLWIYKATDVWFKPMVVILVSPLLVRLPQEWKAGSGNS